MGVGVGRLFSLPPSFPPHPSWTLSFQVVSKGKIVSSGVKQVPVEGQEEGESGISLAASCQTYHFVGSSIPEQVRLSVGLPAAMQALALSHLHVSSL